MRTNTPSSTLIAILTKLVAGLSLVLTCRLTAQTFNTLYSFSTPTNGLNSDGYNPKCTLVLSGTNLYGTTWSGGGSRVGTVFALNTDGSGFTTLYAFTDANDGGYLYDGVILSDNTLYGTTRGDLRIPGYGAVFAVSTDGGGFTTLYSFTGGSDGGDPYGSLILSTNTLYGTSAGGNASPFASGYGTVFAVNTDGSAFTTLYSFTGGSDGGSPRAGLLLSGNTLYGTTANGGSWSNGTVFSVKTDGTGFTNLHSFTAVWLNPVLNTYTNADGASPQAGLVLSGDTLYGTAGSGGSLGNGAVFKLNPDGTGFTNLHSFTAVGLNPVLNTYTNADGASPQAGLVLSGDTLYGTAGSGGSSGNGAVFKLCTNGTHFVTLHAFTALSPTRFDPYVPGTNTDGADPEGGLVLSGNTLYGAAAWGGSGGVGTIFSLALPAPRLSINISGANVILTWPINGAGFTLQTSPDLSSPTNWVDSTDTPAIVADQYMATNTVSGRAKFYRLKQ